MYRVVVINSKGGCGKTTVASNLASFYAFRGFRTALFDYDPQGSSMHWLSMRSPRLPSIFGVATGGKQNLGTTRAFQFRVPAGTERIIVDTPAALKRMDMSELLRGASAILVPMLPSAIDRHVTLEFLRDIRIVLRSLGPSIPIGIVANRVVHAASSYHRLVEELRTHGFPLVTSLRDSEAYAIAAESGAGVHELGGEDAAIDEHQWNPLLDWVDGTLRTQAPRQPASRANPGAVFV